MNDESEDDQQRFAHETATKPSTICATCHYAPSNARYESWWNWLCRHPNARLPQTFNYVTGQVVADPPYMKCKNRNVGACPDYAESQNVFGIKIRKKQEE